MKFGSRFHYSHQKKVKGISECTQPLAISKEPKHVPWRFSYALKRWDVNIS